MEFRDIYDFLKDQRYGVVSSIAADGTPQSALVGIATTPQFVIIFDTLKSSRKYSNLLSEPRCSLVVGWSDERSVQLEGVANEPAGDELPLLEEAYFAVWPEGAPRRNRPDLTYFCIRTTWLRYSDYSQNPPFIFETDFSECTIP
jgi:hypothetical protein